METTFPVEVGIFIPAFLGILTGGDIKSNFVNGA